MKTHWIFQFLPPIAVLQTVCALSCDSGYSQPWCPNGANFVTTKQL
jgi:hypothetical protein